jgi:uncharacterized protein YcfJ
MKSVRYSILTLVILVTGCSTASYTMVHPKTKQVVIVGGSATGSLVGGAIGYQIEKSNNLKQVQKLKSEGFVIQDVSN